MACVIWAIWGCQNQWVHEKIYRSGKSLIDFVHKYIEKVDSTNLGTYKMRNLTVKWEKPNQNIMKINFDRTFNDTCSKSASRVVVCDLSRTVLCVRSEIHKQVPSPFAAEAIACQKALELALEQDLQRVIMEGDSQTIIKKGNAPDLDRSAIGAYIANIHSLLQRLREAKMRYIPRSANGLAHVIAKKTLEEGRGIHLIHSLSTFAEQV